MVWKGLVVVLFATLLSSCIRENNPQINQFGNATLGQQLIDLKRALDKGATSESEYQRLRNELLSAYAGCASASDEDG